MGVLKISFLLKSPSVNWNYKSVKNSNLSDDLADAIAKTTAPSKPVCDSKSSVQFHFYVATDSDTEQQKAIAKKILEELITDEATRKMIVISVTEPDGDEIKKLQQSANVSDNKAFWEAAGKYANSAATRPTAPQKTTTADKAKTTAAEQPAAITTKTHKKTEEPEKKI